MRRSLRSFAAASAYPDSAEIKTGTVRFARIASEKGGTLRIAYPEAKIIVTVNGEPAELTAEDLSRGIGTSPGTAVEIRSVTKNG